MRIMFTISAREDDAAKADELKEKLEALFKEYELQGDIKGKAFEKGTTYSGVFGI